MTLKIIIAGGRDFNDYSLLCYTLDDLRKPFEVVCGEARGADSLGKRYAIQHGLTVHSFPADWAKLGKSAGHVRNAQMAEFADGLVAFWDGQSKGTAGMIRLAERRGLKVKVVRYA
jgi:hypothetical protein